MQRPALFGLVGDTLLAPIAIRFPTRARIHFTSRSLPAVASNFDRLVSTLCVRPVGLESGSKF